MKIFIFGIQILWGLLILLTNYLSAATIDHETLDRFFKTHLPCGKVRTFVPNMQDFVFVSSAKIGDASSILHTNNILSDEPVIIVYNRGLPGRAAMAHLDGDFTGTFDDLINPLHHADLTDRFMVTLLVKGDCCIIAPKFPNKEEKYQNKEINTLLCF